MILAGDIGGAKTHIALFGWKTERGGACYQGTHPRREYGALEEILTEFFAARKAILAEQKEAEAAPEESGERAEENETPSPPPSPGGRGQSEGQGEDVIE